MTTLDPNQTLAALLEVIGRGVAARQYLQQLEDAIDKELRDTYRVMIVEIYSPQGEAPELVATVQKYFAEHTHQIVQVIEKADPSLIGGALLRFGDQQIDMSVRGALEQAASVLMSKN